MCVHSFQTGADSHLSSPEQMCAASMLLSVPSHAQIHVQSLILLQSTTHINKALPDGQDELLSP